MMQRLLLALFVTVQCRPSASSDAGATPPATSSTSPTSIADGASAIPARAKPTTREIVDAWNVAHTKHDVGALESLYAARVVFYGQTLTNKQCVEKKKAAFARTPDYAQSIRDVVVGNDGVVTFTKTSTSGGKSTDYPAVLVVSGTVVSGETDKVTEAHLAAQASRTENWCLDESWSPTDKLVPPYRLSALYVYRKARDSKYFKDAEAAHNGDFLDFGQVSCPTECDRPARKCGYTLRLENHSQHVQENPEPHSNLVDWVYVDAVDGTLWSEGTSKSELLPP